MVNVAVVWMKSLHNVLVVSLPISMRLVFAPQFLDDMLYFNPES